MEFANELRAIRSSHRDRGVPPLLRGVLDHIGWWVGIVAALWSSVVVVVSLLRGAPGGQPASLGTVAAFRRTFEDPGRTVDHGSRRAEWGTPAISLTG